MQPPSHSTNSTHFTTQRSTVLYNFNNFITLTNTISKLPEDGAEAAKHVGAFVM